MMFPLIHGMLSGAISWTRVIPPAMPYVIREKHVLVVDDNPIGTRPEHIARAKDLFRAMAQANLRRKWVAQATVNFGDDEELLALAAKAQWNPRRKRLE